MLQRCALSPSRRSSVNEGALHTLSEALLEFETLNGEEVEAILRGEDIHEIRRELEPPPPEPEAATDADVESSLAESDPQSEGGKPLEGYAY